MKRKKKPVLVIIGGPNGAGKTTCAMNLLPKSLKVSHFVNADLIAKGLSPFNPSLSDIEAGRVMLTQLNKLIGSEESLAFETTLSTRSFVNVIKKAKVNGYYVVLLYIWLSSPRIAESRVAARVKEGGHGIPKEVIARRYIRGAKNFWRMYKDFVDTWFIFDNSQANIELVAFGGDSLGESIVREDMFKEIKKHDKE